jgi:integrase
MPPQKREELRVVCFVTVKQSVWRGKLQTPKTANSIRQFAVSQKLASHLRAHLSTWRPNLLNLVFATKNGTPWDQNLVVKRKLHPLLESLGIRRCGLHAFRHTNGSLMDRLNAPMKIRQERFGHAPGSNLLLVASTLTRLRKMTGWWPNNWARCCVQMWPNWHKRKPSQSAKAW